MNDFEKVIEISDYYDGPREGLANFQGQPHKFKSRMLDMDDNDDTLDQFDLTPVQATSTTVVAYAEFRRIGSGPLPPREWPVLEVRWTLQKPVGA